MKQVRAYFRFAAFVAATFGIYSLWFAAPLLRSTQSKLRLRQFIMRNWARAFVRIANCKLKVNGNPPQPPFLLVSNHVGYFDIAVLGSTAKCVFVAKADIETWAIAGTMVKNMGHIFINRENRRDIPRAGAKIVAALECGEGITIFAEGTSGSGEQILPFKSSFLEFAAQKNLPVHYAAVSYQTPADEPPASEAVCWWRLEDEFAPHLFKMFQLRTFEGTITFGAEPIHSPNRKELTRQLEAAVNEIFEPIQ